MTAPRQLAHRGAVLAEGLWISGPDACARTLANWAPNAAIWAVDDGFVLRFGAPRRLRADEAEGAPLTGHDGALWAFPPSGAERAALRPPAGALVLAVGGEARVLPRGPLIAPATLLSAEVCVLPLEDLGAPPVPPPAPKPAPALDRASFGQPPADPAAEETRMALLAPARPPTGAALLVKALLDWSRRRADASAEAGSKTSESDDSPLARLLAGLWGRGSGTPLLNRLLDWLDQAALGGLLRAQLGARHAQRLSQLLDDLDGGDLDRALRMAIPLSDEPGGVDSGLDLRLPKPREQLNVEPATTLRSPLALGTELFDDLRARYARAAQKLEQEGRFEDAAFVLAQLLGQADAAVLLLERNERFTLAADIAEARQLPVARQVALRLRAGEVDRAMDLARRGGVMLEAARLLERSAPDQARQLLLAHVTLLAGSGQLLAALAALPPGREPRVEEALLRIALDREHLALALAPERFLPSHKLRPDWLIRARALLTRPGGDTLQEGLIRALSKLTPTQLQRFPEHKALSAVCRDAARLAMSAPDCDPAVLSALALHSPALSADLNLVLKPTLPRVLLRYTRLAEDRGAMPILDAALTEAQALLIALGESGLELRVHGAPARRFPVPAHRLAVLGDRALAMVLRGEVWELRTVDLQSGAVELWADLRLPDPIATLTRGLWLVAEEEGLALYDPLAPKARVLWRGGPRAPVEALAASEDSKIWAIAPAEGEKVLWSWSREDLLLRDRLHMPDPPAANTRRHLRDDGAVFEAMASPTQPVLALWSRAAGDPDGAWREYPSVALPGLCHPRPLALLSFGASLLVALARVEGGALLLRLAPQVPQGLLDPRQPQLTLEGARTVGLRRIGPHSALAWDDLGRAFLLGGDRFLLREWRS